MEYKWLLRGGKMQRIRIGKPQRTKKINHRCKKVHRRIEHNKDLIAQRKNSEMSAGEIIVSKFLIKNGVEFIREHYDLKLINRGTGNLLFFDFYLPKYKMVIEFDGAYHYKPIKGKDELNKQIDRDLLKDNYCKNNKIKILRIPYWQDVEKVICEYFDKHF